MGVVGTSTRSGSVKPVASPNHWRIVGEKDENGHLDPDSLSDLPFGVCKLRVNVAGTVCLGKGDESLVDARHKIITKKFPDACNKEEQAGSKCVGPVFGANWTCRGCWCNFHNALCNRHAKAAPPVTHQFTHALKMLDTVSPEVRRVYEAHWDFYHKLDPEMAVIET